MYKSSIHKKMMLEISFERLLPSVEVVVIREAIVVMVVVVTKTVTAILIVRVKIVPGDRLKRVGFFDFV